MSSKSPILREALFTSSVIAALLLTLMLGAGPYFRSEPHSLHLYLARSFDVYDRASFLQHGFLAFGEPQDFERGRAYAHLSQPYLAFHYALATLARMLLGTPHVYTQNISFLVVLSLLAAAALDIVKRTEAPIGRSPKRFWQAVAVTIATLTVFTDAPLWGGFAGFARHNCYALGLIPFLWLAAHDALGTLTPRFEKALLLLAIVVAPFYTPAAVLLYLALHGTGPLAKPTRDLFAWSVVLGLVGAICFFLPAVIASLLSFDAYGSGYAFRSGLDGDRRYFTSMVQAVFAPFDARANRPWNPGWLPLSAAILVAWRFFDGAREEAVLLLRTLLIGLLPYISLVLFFPQMVSVHPYFFDLCFSLPAAWAIFVWSVHAVPGQAWRAGRALFWMVLALFAFGSNLQELATIFR